MHHKEIGNQQKKMVTIEKRVQDVDKLLKEEEEKRRLEEVRSQATLLSDNSKKEGKDAKKGEVKKPVVQEPSKDAKGKKGGKQEVLPTNPLELEKLECLKEMDKCKAVIDKYTQKLDKLKEMQNKYAKLDTNALVLELVDKTGERKYVKTKLMSVSNSFLTDKGSYFLTKIIQGPLPTDEEVVELINLDGFAIRTIEEDEKFVDVPDVVLKGKETKKGKKGK